MPFTHRPGKQGLYDPQFEHDSCGVGFVAHIKGQQSHSIVEKAKEIIINMEHRGAVGSEADTGDGAGILTSIPHAFLEKIARTELGVHIPPRGKYACGLVFLPQNREERRQCKRLFEQIISEEGGEFMSWRTVPSSYEVIGPSAKASEPVIEQAFIAAKSSDDQDAFERKLFIMRKRASHSLRGGLYDRENFFYICSLSSRLIVYKGMLMPEQLFSYFYDLSDSDYKTHVAMVHSRFSTNTFPSWDRAQPLRCMSHNGEINTLRGNINKMRAREGQLQSPLFGDSLKRAFPIIEKDLSDSGNFDNVLELLLLSGKPLEEAIMMMVPEAWQKHLFMPEYGREMYEYFSCLMEPWDGPASIAFTDGKVIGAVLDRNGLRPSRYYITKDDLVIMASEVGVLDIPPAEIRLKGRLQPGMMFFVDFVQGRIIEDNEVKTNIAKAHPYRTWLRENRIELSDLLGQEKKPLDDNLKPTVERQNNKSQKDLLDLLKLHGYSREHLADILKPMAENAKEPLGSMGNDSPLAVLSSKPRLLYDYFKQLFAQVTNPPIDSIREDIVMSLRSYIGPEENLLGKGPRHAARLHVPQPVLLDEELSALKNIDREGWSSRVIDITYPASLCIAEDEGLVLKRALDRVCEECDSALLKGVSFVILSDKNAGKERIPISSLLASATVHHHLVRKAARTKIGIILESGEAREVHHFCMLLGYGADAINPYLAYKSLAYLIGQRELDSDISIEHYRNSYITALCKGMLKVFGKMGISTIDSYKGAQIFEAVGLDEEVISRCFCGTASRIGGDGFNDIALAARKRYESVFEDDTDPYKTGLQSSGDLRWRREGEAHMWDPESIANLRIAARNNDRNAYLKFSQHQNDQAVRHACLRGLMQFRKKKSIPLDAVESVEDITKRFSTGAMSFGSLSQEAHETLAIAMNRIGGKSNTGEGGELPERFKPLSNGDSKRSAIKQVASGRFGVNAHYLANADEIQIKMAQGAKPGEGGELPGKKVFEIIAKTRYSTPGVGLISPPPHHDIYSIEDLAQLIFDLKNANPQARISVKLVSEVGVGTVAAGVAKAHADHILISGHDGGTGASPLTGIKNAGLPWELGIAETHSTLVLNNLRTRVVLQTDGQLKTGRDVVIAALLGAEEYGFATAPLITMGCIMMRKCQKNSCPVGIATQDERLRKRFSGRPEHLINYFRFVASEVREIMAELGLRRMDELIGRTDLLEQIPNGKGGTGSSVDLSAVLNKTESRETAAKLYGCSTQDHGIDDVFDRQFLKKHSPLIDLWQKIVSHARIRNTDRAVGTMISNYISRKWAEEGLPDGSIHFKLSGSAGQSFGAWLTRGLTLELEGDANDYTGKGLSGGRIILYPDRESSFVPEDNIIVGNVALYGAISGEAFFRGQAAERFCVRNSGAHVVVEGVGDHGCEYMTGGRVLVLGPIGRNFAAGMSGGIAYLRDVNGDLAERINPVMVEIDDITEEDEETIQRLLRRHVNYTASTPAEEILSSWPITRNEFKRVISPAYRKIVEVRKVKELVHG